MSEYTRVSLVLVGESMDDHVYGRITEEARLLMDDSTVEYIVHAYGTNTVEVLAHLDQSEIGKKIEQLKKIANVKDVVIQEKHRVVQRSVTEPAVNVQDSVSASKHVKRSITEPTVNLSDSVALLATRFKQSPNVTIEEKL